MIFQIIGGGIIGGSRIIADFGVRDLTTYKEHHFYARPAGTVLKDNEFYVKEANSPWDETLTSLKTCFDKNKFLNSNFYIGLDLKSARITLELKDQESYVPNNRACKKKKESISRQTPSQPISYVV